MQFLARVVHKIPRLYVVIIRNNLHTEEFQKLKEGGWEETRIESFNKICHARAQSLS